MSTPTTTLTPEQLYQLIKEYEAEIPIPAPFVTVQVGTFDAAAGRSPALQRRSSSATGRSPGTTFRRPASRDPSTSPIRSTRRGRETVTRVPAPVVPVAPVLLQFNVTNFTGPWSVTVDGYTTNAAAGQASVSVNAWDITAHNWTLQAGAGGHQDRLSSSAPEHPAAGGFTIPLLPVAIVYAPPADSETRAPRPTPRATQSEPRSPTTSVPIAIRRSSRCSPTEPRSVRSSASRRRRSVAGEADAATARRTRPRRRTSLPWPV